MQTLVQDIRYAFRQLRRAPGFTITAALTLSIGIGANTAIFTLVHAVLLKSLPVGNPAQLYKLGDEYNCCVQGSLQDNWSMFSYPMYVYFGDHTPEFEQLAASQTNRPRRSVRRLGTNAPAEMIGSELVSGNYFQTLGVGAFAGRVLTSEDDRPGAAPVAVMSYRTWQLQYGGDPTVVGAAFTINSVPATIVGISAPGFFGDRLETDPPGIWMPVNLEPTFAHENSLLKTPSTAWLYSIGRLRGGVDPASLSAKLTTELRQFLSAPGNSSPHQDLKKLDRQTLRVAPGGGGINAVKDEFERGLLLLMAASAAVLIIACANLANLLLARGEATRVRTALQLAIGASRGRIVRSQLTESVLLALIGGAGGLLLARYATEAMLLIAFRGATYVPISTTPSMPVLLFAFGVSLATGIVFGVGPAWLAAGAEPSEALRGANRVVRDSSAFAQKALVVVQAALSVVLLTVAGLMTTSLRNLDSQPYGFEREGRLVVQFNPAAAGYGRERLTGLYTQILDRFEHLPGVVDASLALYTVQQGNNWGESVFFSGKTGEFGSSWDRVSAHYFETIGNTVVRGRGFRDDDTAASQRVAVVNEAFARRYFQNQDPIGQHFGKDEASHANDYEIVGVARDAKYQEASRTVRPMFFVPLPQKIVYETAIDNRAEDSSMYMGSLILHTQGDPGAMASQARRALASIDPNLTPTSMETFEENVRIQTSERTLTARLADAFGAIALLLASIGLYGVTAYRVARRTGEVGLRMALGASRWDIISLVLRGAFLQVAIGLAVGIPLAVLAKMALQHQLFGIGAFDPWSVGAAVAVLALSALVASVLPAGRAAGIDPMQALRAE